MPADAAPPAAATPPSHHPLDRPVWFSLANAHQPLSQGGPLARRYRDGVHQFASACDDGPQALAALAELLPPGERVFVLQAAPIVVPPGLQAVQRGRGLQMVATRPLHDEAAQPGPAIGLLGEADADDMLALTALTEPGPFLPRTHTMGRFIGVRSGPGDGGALVAMAGERFRPPGHVEVSAVCTHPQWRGQGLARRLSATVAAAIQARGDTPFLHAWLGNTAAIALYRQLGFAPRCEVDVAVLQRG